MMDFVDKIVGVYHFLIDRAPRDIPLVDPRPHPANPWLRNGQPLMAKVKVGGDIRAAIEKAIALLGSLEEVIDRDDRVLLKPNFNSQDPYPGSTDLVFMRAVIELLLETGAKVTIGESSGGIWRPTRKVFRKVGVFELARDLGVELIAFDDKPDDWVRVRINGDYLSSVFMPRSAYEADKIVYLPCLKTHNLARFSGALKLAVGFVHPGERRALHAHNLEQKIAEISLCWQPNLIIMDGRKVFVSGGPARGQLAEPEVVLASGDLVVIDVEAIKVLLAYEANNKLVADPWQLPQIVTALRHGLGMGQNSYIVVE
ncbi:MAG: DUF362 domain-containing protein [Chloroflexota bacterium]